MYLSVNAHTCSRTDDVSQSGRVNIINMEERSCSSVINCWNSIYCILLKFRGCYTTINILGGGRLYWLSVDDLHIADEILEGLKPVTCWCVAAVGSQLVVVEGDRQALFHAQTALVAHPHIMHG